ncbi:MAG: YciI family protein [Kofleriaceae bacterium]
MFIIELTYVVPLPQIDAAMKRHMAYLDRRYADGTFVMSGRKVPRDGGIILATGDDRAAIEAIAADDPFVAEGLATARIIEFRPSQLAPDLPARLAVAGSQRRGGRAP